MSSRTSSHPSSKSIGPWLPCISCSRGAGGGLPGCGAQEAAAVCLDVPPGRGRACSLLASAPPLHAHACLISHGQRPHDDGYHPECNQELLIGGTLHERAVHPQPEVGLQATRGKGTQAHSCGALELLAAGKKTVHQNASRRAMWNAARVRGRHGSLSCRLERACTAGQLALTCMSSASSPRHTAAPCSRDSRKRRMVTKNIHCVCRAEGQQGTRSRVRGRGPGPEALGAPTDRNSITASVLQGYAQLSCISTAEKAATKQML